MNPSASIPPLRIGWLLFTPIIGSGGYRTIFDITNLLTSFGHTNIFIVSTDLMPYEYKNSPDIYIHKYFGSVSAIIHPWNETSIDVDILLATEWNSFKYLDKYQGRHTKAYFVQDFEPYFMPMSYEYLQAEKTYMAGVPCISIGRWLAEFLKQRYQSRTFHFDFAIDHEVYYPKYPFETKNKILFYARPSTPRRCFWLGIEALFELHKRSPDLEIVLFGDTNLHNTSIPFPFTNCGIVSPAELADLYSKSLVGLVLSSTNPSRTPPEMMACGCPVVDLDLPQNHLLIEHGKTGLLAEVSPSAIANTIYQIARDNEFQMYLAKNAISYAKQLSWEHSARQVEQALWDIVRSHGLYQTRELQTMLGFEHWIGEGVSPPLTTNLVIGQRFIAYHDGLCSVVFAVAHGSTEIPVLRIFKGIKDQSMILETAEGQYQNNTLVYTFLPLYNIEHTALYCTLTATDGPRLRFDYESVAGGSITYNDIPQVGQLLTRVFYQTDRKDVIQYNELKYLQLKNDISRYEYEMMGTYLHKVQQAQTTPPTAKPLRYVITTARDTLAAGNWGRFIKGLYFNLRSLLKK